MPFFSKKYKLGLDIGSSLIKVCLPRQKGMSLVMSMETPEGMVSKGVLQPVDEVSASMRQWIRNHQLDRYPTVACLPASTLVLRHIQVPKLRPKETAEAIEWEARRVLPFPLEEAQMDWMCQNTIITDEGEMQEILLVAVRDTIVDRYVRAVKEAGLTLAALDIAPMALGRWLINDSEASLIIDIGAETTQIHFFDEGKLSFSRSLSIGGSEATRAIAAVNQLSFTEAEERKLRGEYKEEWLMSWHRELGREIQRSLEYYRTTFNKHDSDSAKRVILSGGGSLTRGIDSLIKDILGAEPGFAEFASREPSARQDKILYNIALGAGMWEE